jgi:hypothetical protein
MDYTPSPSSPNMGMKKKAVASKLANMKNATKKKKMDMTGFLTYEQVQEHKKSGKTKDWTEKYGKKK